MAEYIQMHHIENNWLCLVHKRERLESRCMTVLYTTVGMNLRRQLVSLYNHHASVDEGVLPVTVIRAQRQAGSSDCGVFAVASAFALAEGKCPTGIWFDQRNILISVDDLLSQQLGTKHKLTTAYHPQTNGLDERTNVSLLEFMSGYLNQTSCDQLTRESPLPGPEFMLRQLLTLRQLSNKDHYNKTDSYLTEQYVALGNYKRSGSSQSDGVVSTTECQPPDRTAVYILYFAEFVPGCKDVGSRETEIKKTDEVLRLSLGRIGRTVGRRSAKFHFDSEVPNPAAGRCTYKARSRLAGSSTRRLSGCPPHIFSTACLTFSGIHPTIIHPGVMRPAIGAPGRKYHLTLIATFTIPKPSCASLPSTRLSSE
ncbi:hypothetical protein Bbelb_377270 [Branchiostoma belcheri]|nr:hypothetical protein Bbelb_377270 [Branchiostoma belcheri]